MFRHFQFNTIPVALKSFQTANTTVATPYKALCPTNALTAASTFSRPSVAVLGKDVQLRPGFEPFAYRADALPIELPRPPDTRASTLCFTIPKAVLKLDFTAHRQRLTRTW